METANKWEYKVGNNTNFVFLKTPNEMSSDSIPPFWLGNNYIDISLLWETSTKIEDTFISVFIYWRLTGDWHVKLVAVKGHWHLRIETLSGHKLF